MVQSQGSAAITRSPARRGLNDNTPPEDLMAPFTHGHCPVCAADTTQHFLLHEHAQEDGELSAVCEVCHTVLTFGPSGPISQRPATAEEEANIPTRVRFSAEQVAEWREDLQQGQAAVEAWIQAGCPGLTSEMVSQMPLLAAALARRGVQLP
jgi:hypothetical protein